MARFFAYLRQSRTSLFVFSTALLALLACVLRTLAFFYSFDTPIGYFRSDSVLVILSNVCLLICAALCAAIPFLINKEHAPVESESLSSPRFISAALTAVSLCFNAFYLVLRVDALPAPKALVLFAALCLLGAATFFLCRLCNVSARITAPLGFFTVLGAALALAITYLDRYTQMNAPHKLSLHLCMLAIMFAMLYELRTLLHRPLPRACIAVTLGAAILCAVYAISNAIAFFAGIYRNVLYLLFDLVALCYSGYFATKLIHLFTTHNAKDTEVEE